MLDLRYLRTHLDDVASQLLIKGYKLDKERFSTLDAARKSADIESQALQAERKQASKQIGQLVQTGVAIDDAKAQVQQTLEKIDASLNALKARSQAADEQIQAFLYDVPNIPDVSVPAGKDESDNVEVMVWGEPRQFDFKVLDHVDLGAGLKGIDFDSASTMSGARFAVLKAGVARLHRALAQFMLDQHTECNGYQEINVPLIVNASALTGTTQLPKFADDLFKLEGDADYFLIPTGEVPVTNLARDAIHEEAVLPLKYAAHTACFRSEAGSHGRDTRGLIRQHQFEKVEMVQFVHPEQSWDALETLVGHAEAILQKLELPYRTVVLCGGDLGFSAAKTYDIEVWLPSQEKYREISSCSNFADFQARRMKARYRKADGKPELLHTLNGSGLAVGRTLLAVMENYQQADGSIAIPAALQPLMNGQTAIS